MLRTIRVAGKIALIASYTAPMMLAQSLALRTGWWSDRRLPQLWHRLTLKVLRIRVRANGSAVRGQPVLLASNHVSWTDILVLGSITGVHFVAKSEVRNWPVMGQFAKLQRSVFVERERKRASSQQAQEIAARLSDGDPMVLFAEGTTSDGNRVLPFKSTLFGAAKLALNETGSSVLVQPVAIAYVARRGLKLNRSERTEVAWIGDADFVPHLLEILKRGHIDVEVVFGEPIEFSSDADRKEVARIAEHQVRQMLASTLRKDRSPD